MSRSCWVSKIDLPTIARYKPQPERIKVRTVHKLEPIAELAAPVPVHETVRQVVETAARHGGAIVDLLGGKFFVRRGCENARGRLVGRYNEALCPVLLAEDLAHALAEVA